MRSCTCFPLPLGMIYPWTTVFALGVKLHVQSSWRSYSNSIPRHGRQYERLWNARKSILWQSVAYIFFTAVQHLTCMLSIWLVVQTWLFHGISIPSLIIPKWWVAKPSAHPRSGSWELQEPPMFEGATKKTWCPCSQQNPTIETSWGLV